MSVDYQIVELGNRHYRIMKFFHSFLSAMYEVKNNKCNCPSGKYRGYCKHKDWVKNIKRLPQEVKVVPYQLKGINTYV